MTAFRALTFAFLLLLASLAGCTDGCAPVTVPTQVALGLVDEEVRTLPILASGATRIAGQDVPDAHGRVEMRLDVTHHGLDNASLAFEDITVTGFTLRIAVDGEQVPIEIVKMDADWRNGGLVVVWWTVDFDPARDPLALALPEGREYTATIDFDWSHRDCYATASGHRTETFNDFVQASVNARTFEAAGAPSIEQGADGVGLKASYRVKSGLNATIRSVEARAVRFGPPAVDATVNTSTNGSLDAAPTSAQITGAIGGDVGVRAAPLAIGLVTFPQLATFVQGNRTTSATPAAPMQVASVGADGQYARSGAMLPGAFPAGPAVYVLTVRITYAPDDATLGTITDVFAVPVVVT
jgi:hypothetical protein